MPDRRAAGQRTRAKHGFIVALIQSRFIMMTFIFIGALATLPIVAGLAWQGPSTEQPFPLLEAYLDGQIDADEVWQWVHETNEVLSQFK